MPAARTAAPPLVAHPSVRKLPTIFLIPERKERFTDYKSVKYFVAIIDEQHFDCVVIVSFDDFGAIPYVFEDGDARGARLRIIKRQFTFVNQAFVQFLKRHL